MEKSSSSVSWVTKGMGQTQDMQMGKVTSQISLAMFWSLDFILRAVGGTERTKALTFLVRDVIPVLWSTGQIIRLSWETEVSGERRTLLRTRTSPGFSQPA